MLGKVVGVNSQEKKVLLEDGEAIPFDTLVLATGARHAYFGHDEWEPYAPGLKTIEDATTIRRRILAAFEHAERETDETERAKFLTFVLLDRLPPSPGHHLELALDLFHEVKPPIPQFDQRTSVDRRKMRSFSLNRVALLH